MQDKREIPTIVNEKIEGQGHKTIAFVALPIYTQVSNLNGLTKIFLSYHVRKEISGAVAGA